MLYHALYRTGAVSTALARHIERQVITVSYWVTELHFLVGLPGVDKTRYSIGGLISGKRVLGRKANGILEKRGLWRWDWLFFCASVVAHCGWGYGFRVVVPPLWPTLLLFLTAILVVAWLFLEELITVFVGN